MQPGQDRPEEKTEEEQREELEEKESQCMPEVLLEDLIAMESMVAKARNSLLKLPLDILSHLN
jgi:hypothetical protein